LVDHGLIVLELWQAFIAGHDGNPVSNIANCRTMHDTMLPIPMMRIFIGGREGARSYEESII